MKSLHSIHSNFIKTNLSISISTFYRLKPFYVVQPTLCETETPGIDSWVQSLVSWVEPELPRTPTS